MKILVGVDLSESTPKIIDKVEDISKALSAKVWLLHAADPVASGSHTLTHPHTGGEQQLRHKYLMK